METFDKLLSVTNNFLWSYVLIALLIVLGLFFTIRSGFVQFTCLGDMIRLLGDGATKGKKRGGISSFQAFCISTASRVGTGNLAGVAIAIVMGGPGAVFWMWLIALVGAGSSFVESTLAQIYKVKDADGFRGGPAYYMEKALKKRWLGVLFAVLITISFGTVFNSVHSNTISLAFEEAFNISRVWCGIILAGVTAIIIFGGVRRIARVVEIMVPVMAISYILVALFIMITNITLVPAVFAQIFKGAFGLHQALGGGIGAAIMWGIKRGLYSNEAGMGSAPNAAATANVSHPVKQGFVQTLGVFTDTLLICSATAFVILLSDIGNSSGLTGIQLTQNALSSHVGAWGNSFVAICILLFAYSSIIGNYYYGETNIEFLNPKKIWLTLFRILVCALVFVGSIAKMTQVWNSADLFMGVLALINLTAIAILSNKAFICLKDYQKQKRENKDPVFAITGKEEYPGAECWEDSEN